MAQLFDSFLSLHCFSSGTEFFNMDKFSWLMHFRVSCAFSVLVKPDAQVQVLGVASVEAVAFAQNHINIVRHF